MRSEHELLRLLHVHGEATVSGSFRFGRSGHMGLYNAELTDASIIVWPWPVRLTTDGCILAVILLAYAWDKNRSRFEEANTKN